MMHSRFDLYLYNSRNGVGGIHLLPVLPGQWHHRLPVVTVSGGGPHQDRQARHHHPAGDRLKTVFTVFGRCARVPTSFFWVSALELGKDKTDDK